MTPQFHPLKVADVRPVTDEAMSIAFHVPEDLRAAYRFVQGQYLTLKAEIGGEELRRSYSICSGLDEGELRVAVKRVPDGRFSNYANEAIKPGDVIEVMTPAGNFHTPIEPETARHYVGFAGGSGITPFMSIIKTILKREPKSQFTLFYGNRGIRQIMFREELEDLKDAYLGRFRLFHILSDERPDVPLFSGLLDAAKTGELLDRLIDMETVDTFYICGPGPMMDAVRAALNERAIDERRQKYELFGTPPPQAGARKVTHAGKAAEVTVILHGNRTTFQMPEGTQSVLEAALAENLELPFSCKGGVCCTCKARLLEGNVEMDVNYGLEPDELEEGFILTCQSHPKSGRLVVDFDH
mgnify:CR=1 FL=1